jgi:hypothetical protein
VNMSRLWALIGFVGVLAILAGGYFVGVAPQLEAADAADESIEQTEALNAGHRAELNRLRELDATAIFSAVDDARATIPASHDQEQYTAQLQLIANDTGTLFQSVTYAEAVVAGTEPAAAPAETDAEAGADATAAAAAPAAGPSGVVAIGVTLEFTGSRETLQALTARLQDEPRIIAVRTATIEGEIGGEYTASIEGFVFVLPDA